MLLHWDLGIKSEQIAQGSDSQAPFRFAFIKAQLPKVTPKIIKRPISRSGGQQNWPCCLFLNGYLRGDTECLSLDPRHRLFHAFCSFKRLKYYVSTQLKCRIESVHWLGFHRLSWRDTPAGGSFQQTPVRGSLLMLSCGVSNNANLISNNTNSKANYSSGDISCRIYDPSWWASLID